MTEPVHASMETPLISATPAAIEHLRHLKEEEGKNKCGVRVGVKGGGCSGFTYALQFDDPREGDHVFEQDGITFMVDRKSAIYLRGLRLDFKSGLMGKGFVFNNPNVSSTCGCGESFSI